MTEIYKRQNIAVIDEGTNFWMVRTKGGFFYEQFIREEFIAVGWNSVTKSDLEGGLSKAKEADLRKNIRDNFGDSVPGTAVGKCHKFLSIMKAGDIAVVVGLHQIAIVRVGEYYEVHDDLHTIAVEKEVHMAIDTASVLSDHFDCPYIKRRKIEVLKVIKKDKYMNPYLGNVLFANRHSISSLTESAEIILTSCFDSFIYQGRLNLIFRAKQKGDINALAFSGFVYGVSDFLTNGKPEEVTVKAALRSPGDIIMQVENGLQFINENWKACLILYAAILGGSVKLGGIEFSCNSFVEVVARIAKWLSMKRFRDIEYEQKQANKKLTDAQIEGVELDNELKRLAIEERKRANQLENISRAANSLEIEVASGVVIPFEEIMKMEKYKP